MGYRRGNLSPEGFIAILWLGLGLYPLLLVKNATGSWIVAVVVYLLPAIALIASDNGAFTPPTRVYFGPRGGAYRINANGRKSYDVTDEEIRRSLEYYDKADKD